MPPSVERRLVILAEGNFGFHHGKTAMGMIRFGSRVDLFLPVGTKVLVTTGENTLVGVTVVAEWS